MSETVIKVENLSKQYRLGLVGTGTLSDDLNRWWAKVRGKEDPFLKVGEVNVQDEKGIGEYVWALKDINFEVKQGEVLGIIGKNGAGKSTLLKILSRVTGPTTGSAKVKGRIASLLEVGTGFHPELTGRENIFLNGAILGMTKSEIKSKFDEIVEFSGVERYIDTPVKRFSSGMHVRLGFAVAAHLDPEILIIDEVLAVGDAEFQKKCLGKMKNVSTEGRTVLFVSHNMRAIQSLCTKTILLQDGEMVKLGPTEKIINLYFEQLFSDGRSFFDNLTTMGTGKAKFRNVQAYNSKGEKTYEILEEESIMFKFEIEIIEKIDALKFRIELRSPENLKETITTTTFYTIDCNNKKQGVIYFEVLLYDMNLRPERYPLLFWLGVDGEAYDIIWDQTPPLIIRKNEKVSSRGHDPDKIVGYFNINDKFYQHNN
ncbi:ABC transporter ATP-binding protein [bacterium AH-315-M05]|nr:ABC transporter ATP-binding protein [bacterium AH-315-M05]